MTICQTYTYYLIIFTNINGNNAIGTWTTIVFQRCLLDYALLCGKYDIMAVKELFIIESADTEECIYTVISFDVKHILYSTSLRVFRSFRYLITLHPITSTLLCKEQHGLVHCRRLHLFGAIFIPGMCALTSYSTILFFSNVASEIPDTLIAMIFARMHEGCVTGPVAGETVG